MFSFTRSEPGVVFAFTNRLDGVSKAPFASLNLGDHVGDDPASVAENRARVQHALGARHLVTVNQVHGVTVADAGGPWPGVIPKADGIVTRTAEVAVAVMVADCAPVLLAALGQGLVAAVHAGRAGLVAGVVPQAVARLRSYGAQEVSAVIGPSICPSCYEVSPEIHEAAAAAEPQARAFTRDGRPAVDVAGAVVAQLTRAGVEILEWVQTCTREDDSLYSHRREPGTGRMAGIVMRTGP